MTMSDTIDPLHPSARLWLTKLAARIHDPAEKALVLLRDPAGHEGGTTRALTRLLGLDGSKLPERIATDADNDAVLAQLLFRDGVSRAIYRDVQRADWWAAAADRPQWPMQEVVVTTRTGEQRTLAVADWAQVRWTRNPVLTHPLTGDQFDLARHGGLADTEIADIKQRSFEHFAELLAALDIADALAAGRMTDADWRRLLLAWWRFGPELNETADNGQLGALWGLLPADTRVPDHSIWDHIDLTSAFAGAFAADPGGDVALLTVSLGPVQPFIAAARSTSDLWAGSHLLARLGWEAMRPLCEALGPDAVLFPRLRGIPQVDLWLKQQMGLPAQLFDAAPWTRQRTDANPLFAAALPNRFVALVPAAQASALAEQCTAAVRSWLQGLGKQVVERLLAEAGLAAAAGDVTRRQMREQLAAFPEVHWASVPFSLIRPRNTARQTDLDVSALAAAMRPFFGDGQQANAADSTAVGFLASDAWRVLREHLDWQDGTRFFSPNPGVLYPAVHDLAERALAAAKASRSFAPLPQHGWRCTLTGESEWLTTDRTQLDLPPGERSDTLWTRIHAARPAWAKAGEHLGALSAVKRLWPSLFMDEVGKALATSDAGESATVTRFVVSTHTVSLAQQLDRWLARGAPGVDSPAAAQLFGQERVALPQRLMRHAARQPAGVDLAARLPALLDAASADDKERYEATAERVRRLLNTGLPEAKQSGRLETYYALIMLDGDRMGAILAGDPETRTVISYRDSFHPQVQSGFDAHAQTRPAIARYGASPRAVSPNRHLAISAALNDFSQVVVPHVIEREYLGRVIYAGGDDVLAMLPVGDMLPAMQRLRDTWSGTGNDERPDLTAAARQRKLRCRNGFAHIGTRLMRMMGRHATASCGAVVAHHQAPLAAVLRELRAAEQRAKTDGGRDAFSIAVVKRSGGALHLTEHWGEPLALLNDLIGFLRLPTVSRRAVYHAQQWLPDLPDPARHQTLLAGVLRQQLERQSETDAALSPPAQQPAALAQRLAQFAADKAEQLADGDAALTRLADFMGIAEFLARESRDGGMS